MVKLEDFSSLFYFKSDMFIICSLDIGYSTIRIFVPCGGKSLLCIGFIDAYKGVVLTSSRLYSTQEVGKISKLLTYLKLSSFCLHTLMAIQLGKISKSFSLRMF